MRTALAKKLVLSPFFKFCGTPLGIQPAQLSLIWDV
uniref:Secreted salivary peptide n=1 Tax=Triatoma infestans TaxID=30076 RepID=A0A161MAN9_TRIIF